MIKDHADKRKRKEELEKCRKQILFNHYGTVNHAFDLDIKHTICYL